MRWRLHGCGRLQAIDWSPGRRLTAPPNWPRTLDWWCAASDSDILGDHEWVHVDRGAPVCAVAHIDTVQPPGHVRLHNGLIFAPTLDDRLGAWLIAQLASHEDWFDILLTRDEEIGASTIASFRMPRPYRWWFSLDRAGEDAVTYSRTSREWESLLRKAGFTLGIGSYSCIADAPGWACGVNIGVGYHANHSPGAYAEPGVIHRQLARLERLRALAGDRHWPMMTPRLRL